MGIDFKRPKHIRGFRFGEVLVWDFTSRPLIEKTASGSIVTFSDGADDVPTKSIVVTIPPTLSGVSSVTETQTGANAWNEEWELGIWNSTGQKSASNKAIRSKDYIPVFSSAEYYIYCDFSVYSSGIIFRLLDENKAFVRTVVVSSSSTKKITMDSSVKYIVWCSSTADGINTYSNNVSVNYPSTVTTYEPYITPTVYTANLGRTIYGGSVDVVNGTGEEEYIKVTFDGSDDEGWAKTNAGPYYTTITGYYKEQGFINGICDSFTMVAEVGLASNMTTDLTCSFYFGNDQNRFYIRYDAMENAAALKTWLSQNPVTVIYKVATPTDFTFDGQEIPTRLGANTMWSDGDMKVIYYAYAD